MCPINIGEMTSNVRAVDDARLSDPKAVEAVRKACADILKLEKERKDAAGDDGDGPSPGNSAALLKAFKAAVKAAGDVIDACDDAEHEAVIQAMEWISEAGKKRAKEIAAEEAKRKKDAK